MKNVLLVVSLVAMVFCASQAMAFDVTLAWDASKAQDLAGYEIHYGLEAGNYTDVERIGAVTEWTIGGLADGPRIYFAVLAYDFGNQKSAFSNEVSAAYNDPPGPPDGPGASCYVKTITP